MCVYVCMCLSRNYLIMDTHIYNKMRHTSWPNCPILSNGMSLPARVRARRMSTRALKCANVIINDTIQEPHTKLYSFRFSCKIVSLTAANTNRMFSVSGKKQRKILKIFHKVMFTTGRKGCHPKAVDAQP